jgi:tetratricopeptide repeat protein 21B
VKQSEGGSLRHQVLECTALMASRAKGDVAAGLSRLLDAASQDPNAVPVLLALARGFLLLRQPAKARNQLKRLAKLPYRPEDGEALEAGCLLLADMHVAAGKYDLAQELCNRCVVGGGGGERRAGRRLLPGAWGL